MQEEFEDTNGAIRNRISKKKKQQWPKEKAQKDKQRSTKRTYITKDRVTQTPLKTAISFSFGNFTGDINGAPALNVLTPCCEFEVHNSTQVQMS